LDDSLRKIHVCIVSQSPAFRVIPAGRNRPGRNSARSFRRGPAAPVRTPFTVWRATTIARAAASPWGFPPRAAPSSCIKAAPELKTRSPGWK
jgi:hypothetical protein